MRVLITGATGFIGKALLLRLQRDGHRITAWVRDPGRARQLLGAEVTLASGDDDALQAAVAGADAVVNLAGEPVAGRRWTRRRRERIRRSRVELTGRLVAAMGELARPPAVLVSASAVGYYGDRGDEALTEESAAGEGFLARVCAEWELAAAPATALGVRVVTPRIGIVLGPGGALEQMAPLFRVGLGGRLGSGRQHVPWIHLEDLVELLALAITDERYRGPLNAVGPAPATNRELTRALGAALGRPTVLPAPALALRLLFGEAAQVLLGSQRVLPARLSELGFVHRYPTLEAALDDLLAGDKALSIEPLAGAPIPKDPYTDRRRPRYLLRQRMRIAAPIGQVFDFFSRAENLGLLTPADLGLEIHRPPESMRRGAVIDYRLRLGPLPPLRWRTVIERWEHERLFVDAQHRGPYRSWWHEHHFRDDGDGTIMEDRVYYAPPLGLLGRIAHRLFIAAKLRHIFGYRARAIRLRFGAEELGQGAALESAA